ncbi:MAG: hypothetical protein ACJ76I_07455 [Gaiellaceae bacterium]
MNREQRRHPEKEIRPPIVPEQEMRSHERPPDELDPRAKSSGHGKKTADKWNQ